MKSLIRALAFTLALCAASAVFSACSDYEITYFHKSDSPVQLRELMLITERIGVDVVNGTLSYGFDDHGGFHGDGMEYVEVQLNHDASEEIKKLQNWQSFPLPEEISTIMYGRTDGEYLTAPQITLPNDDKPLIPQIENGYYLFYDKQNNEEGLDPHDYSRVLSPSRYSVNFCLAVYDSDEEMFYFCENDT